MTVSIGLWPGAPNRPNFLAQRTKYGLDAVPIYYRERGGRGSLDEPLVKDPIPPNTIMAVEIDPRYGGAQEPNYRDGVQASQDTANINRLANEAADLPEGSYCEIGSEFNLLGHRLHRNGEPQSDAEARVGFRAFTIAVATALRERAPHVKRVCSGTAGLWRYDDPDAWFSPEVLALLDGIATDGYFTAYTVPRIEKSMPILFGEPRAYADAKGLPLYLTEIGVEEHGDDGGVGKAADLRHILAWCLANGSTDGGRTGLVHLMYNTSTDGKGPEQFDWPPDTTPAAEAAFQELVDGLTQGGTVVTDPRIAELEAELVQVNAVLERTQEENEALQTSYDTARAKLIEVERCLHSGAANRRRLACIEGALGG